MKIGKKEINLLIGLLGIIIAVAAWSLVASPMKEKTAALEAENVGLKQTADEYQAVNAMKAQFEEDTVRLIDERAGLLKSFAAGMSKEDQIMYWANMERANSTSLAIDGLTMAGWSEVYVNSDAQNAEAGATQLHLYVAPVNYTYQATYDGLKNMIKYVFAQESKKSIEQVTIGFDSNTGNLVGTMDMNMYYMVGTDNEYKPAVIPQVPTGVADVFHSVDKLVGSNGVSSFDSGEAEAADTEEAAD